LATCGMGGSGKPAGIHGIRVRVLHGLCAGGQIAHRATAPSANQISEVDSPARDPLALENGTGQLPRLIISPARHARRPQGQPPRTPEDTARGLCAAHAGSFHPRRCLARVVARGRVGWRLLRVQPRGALCRTERCARVGRGGRSGPGVSAERAQRPTRRECACPRRARARSAGKRRPQWSRQSQTCSLERHGAASSWSYWVRGPCVPVEAVRQRGELKAASTPAGPPCPDHAGTPPEPAALRWRGGGGGGGAAWRPPALSRAAGQPRARVAPGDVLRTEARHLQQAAAGTAARRRRVLPIPLRWSGHRRRAAATAPCRSHGLDPAGWRFRRRCTARLARLEGVAMTHVPICPFSHSTLLSSCPMCCVCRHNGSQAARVRRVHAGGGAAARFLPRPAVAGLLLAKVSPSPVPAPSSYRVFTNRRP